MKPKFLWPLTLSLCLLVSPCLLAQAAEDHFFDSAGVPIRYIVEGEGEPVILIHGFTATAEANWVASGVFKALAEDYRVIAVDNRGHGKSGKPHDPESYGVAMVQDIVRLLDHLKIQQAHVAGYSMGGFITLKLLDVAPERIASAVVGGAGWEPVEEGAKSRHELATSLEEGQGFGPLFEALAPVGQPPMPAEQIEAFNHMLTARNDVLALAAVIRGMAGLGVTREKVAAIQVPTLALIGSADPLKAGVDALKSVLPSLEVVVVEGANHITTTNRPEFLQGLRRFFAQHSLEGAGGRTEPTAASAAETSSAHF